MSYDGAMRARSLAALIVSRLHNRSEKRGLKNRSSRAVTRPVWKMNLLIARSDNELIISVCRDSNFWALDFSQSLFFNVFRCHRSKIPSIVSHPSSSLCCNIFFLINWWKALPQRVARSIVCTRWLMLYRLSWLISWCITEKNNTYIRDGRYKRTRITIVVSVICRCNTIVFELKFCTGHWLVFKRLESKLTWKRSSIIHAFK